MDIMWHIPASKAIHQLRHVAASMMRVRVRAAEVDIRDLSSYLVGLYIAVVLIQAHIHIHCR